MLPLFLVQMSALKAVGKPGQEEDVAQVHRIRITLTSRNVKNLEKGAKLLPCFWPSHWQKQKPSDMIPCDCCARIECAVDHLCSVRRPHQGCQGQEPESEGPRAHPYQGAAHHHQEVALWRGYQHMGPLRDEVLIMCSLEAPKSAASAASPGAVLHCQMLCSAGLTCESIHSACSCQARCG